MADSGMRTPDFRVLIGSEGGFNPSGASGKLINKELKSVVGQMKGALMPRVTVGLNLTETKRILQQQLQAIANGLDITAPVKTKLYAAESTNKVFDSAKLQAEGRRYYEATNDVLERVKRDFATLGKVDITNVFKNPQGEIQSFTATIKDADTIVESFRFKLRQLDDGAQTFKGFVQTTSTLTDKRAGTGLDQALDYFSKVESRLANLSSKTLISGSKVLLPEMPEYEQYNTRLAEVKNRIQEIQSSTTALSSDHRREIDRMIGDLTRYARELQTSAYAGGELKAQSFTAKKAQLQAELENSIKQWQTGGIFGGDFERSVNEARTILNNATDSAGLDTYTQKLRLLKAEFQGFKLDDSAWDSLIKANTLDTKIATARQKIQNLKKTYSAFVGDPTLVKEWQQLFDQSKIVSSEKELGNLNARVAEFEQELIAAGKHGSSVFSEMANNFSKMAAWMAMGTVVAGITRGITGIYDAVVDVDTAMTELRKVTSATAAEYDKFLNAAAGRAVDLGAGLPDLIQAVSNFARLGDYTLETAEKLGEAAVIYANVGDEIESIDDATESIISSMKAFDILESDAMSITDKFNEVGNNFAISSGGIGEAMKRSASSLALANNTIDESIGLIVAANNVVQDHDVVGTAWKTISMRIRGAKSELEAAGLETDGMIDSTSKLRELVSGLTGGVDIMLDESTFKSTYQIIKEISEVWDQMTDIDQASLLELLAGKRQGNVLASTITNFEDAEKAMRTAMESSGSAMAEHAKWMDSIEAKQQRFSAQYSAFAQAVLDSDLIKGTFDVGTGLLGWMTSLVETTGALPPLLATLSGFHSLASGDGFFRVDTDKDWGGSGIGISTALGMSKKAAAEFAAQIETDYQCLLKWEKAVAAGNISIENFNTVMEGASSQARTYATQTRGATGAAKEFKAAQVGVASSAQKAGIATKAASVGVQALNLAMNMLLGFGVALALQGLATGFDHIANAAVNASEKADEVAASRREVATAAAEEAAEINELIAKYEKLRKADYIDSGTRAEIASIQSEITDLVGTQASNLDLVNGKLDEELKKLQQISLESATAAQDAAVGSYHAARESADKATGDKDFLWVGGYDYVGDRDEEAYDLLKDILSAEGLPIATKGGLFDSTLFINTYGDAEERIEQLRKAVEALKQANDYNYTNSDLYSGLTAQLNHYETYVSQANEAAINLAETTAEKAMIEDKLSGVVIDSAEAYRKYRSELLATVTADEALSAAVADGSVTTELLTDAIDALMASNFPEWYNTAKKTVVTANEEMAASTVDLSGAIEEFQGAADQIETFRDVLQSLSEVKGSAVPLEIMTELLELCPEAAGKIQNVADAQELLNGKIQEQEEIARNAYISMQLQNKEWVEDTINNSESLQNQLIEHYGANLENWRELAGDKWLIDKRLVDELYGLWNEYLAYTDEELLGRLDSLKKFSQIKIGIAADAGLENSLSEFVGGKVELNPYNPLESQINAQIEELETVLELRKQMRDGFSSVDFNPTTVGNSGSSTDKNKATFEENYKYMKHELEMERITLQDFYDWLDGQDGYKKYFSDLSKYADEWRQYEEEVFKGRREISEAYLDDLDHEIDMLEGQKNSEDAVIAKYKEKQAVLKELQAAQIAYLRSAGLSDVQIANNDTLQAYVELWKQCQDAIDDVIDTLDQDLADSMSSILELTVETVRQEREDEKETLENISDEYEKIVNQRIEMLRLSQQEQDYQESIEAKTKELAKLEARRATLSRDDSREARVEEAALAEQIAELQKEIQKETEEHFLTSTENQLQKELDDFEAQQDDKLREIERFLDNNEAVTKVAMSRLENMNDALFDKLLDHALKYTDMTREELVSMWNDALAAAEKYGSFANVLQAHPSGESETRVSEIMDEMRENGRLYGSTNDKTKQAEYARRNEILAEELSDLLGTPVTKDQNGYWWVNGQHLFNYGDSSASAGSNARAVSSVVNQMRALGATWGAASESERERIHDDVADLAAGLDQYGVHVKYNKASGEWCITKDELDSSNVGKLLYECYHQGGVAGGYADLRQREVLAKLEVGEMILTKQHQENLVRFMDSVKPVQDFGEALAAVAGKLNGGNGGDNVTVQVSAPLSVSNDISNAKFKKMAQDNARYIANEVAKACGV